MWRALAGVWLIMSPMPEMDDLTRYRLCLLALMNADIDRGERKWQLSLEEARDALRKELKRQGFASEGPRGRLVFEDFSSLCSAIAQGSTAETLGLLVDVCAADPWAEMKDTPKLGTGVREHFLARLSLALPGDTDEDDPEYVDEYLQEGRGLFRWSTAKWIVVLAGAAGAGSAILAVEAADVALLVGAGRGGHVGGQAIVRNIKALRTPDLVVAAVVKRFALIRALDRYDVLEDHATEQRDLLLVARTELRSQRDCSTDKKRRAKLNIEVNAFDVALKRLEKHGRS
jgi:hypothetical protein